MKKAITIKEIAQELGLSRNTVSKALNGQYVPPKTREIVLRKAKELNYKCFSDESLASKKYRILLLSGKPIHNMTFFLPLVKSVENYCFDKNYDFFQYTYHSNVNSFWSISEHIRSLNVDGIIAIECFDGDFVNSLLDMDLPVCFIDFPGYKFDLRRKFDLLCCADQKVVCEYLKQLIDGYKLHRFTYVGDYRHCLSFHERYMGMLRALYRTKHSHHVGEDILEDDQNFDYGNVEALKAKISALQRFPECFVCCNDFVAKAVAEALRQLGYIVPDDTMVIGFDGVVEAKVAIPPLTTFYVDKEYLGINAIRTLVNRIERKDSPTTTIMMDCDLIVRESTTRKK